MGCADACSVGGSQYRNHIDSRLGSLHFSSAYTQYKSDNAKIANWLGRAALSNGYPRSDLVVDRSQHSQEDKEEEGEHSLAPGEGKARSTKAAKRARARANAKARAAGQGPAGDEAVMEGPKHGNGHVPHHHTAGHTGQNCCSNHTPKSVLRVSQARPSRFILTIRQYTSIARHVADKAIAVPTELIRILDRCIQLRNRCARIHTTQLGQTSGDFGHQHFVNVLDDIREMLAPLVVHTDPRPTSARKSAKREEQLNAAAGLADDNRFSGLEAVEDLADIDIPASANSGTASLDIFGLEMSIEEAEIRALAFFSDVRTLREHLKGVWQDYKEGHINLVTASIVNNAAIDMVRKSCDDMAKHVVPLFRQSTLLGAMYLMQLYPDDHEDDPTVMIMHLTQLLASQADSVESFDQAIKSPGTADLGTMYWPMYYLREQLRHKLKNFHNRRFWDAELDPSRWMTEPGVQMETLCRTTLSEIFDLVCTCVHQDPFQGTQSVQSCHFISAIWDTTVERRISLLSVVAVQFWLDSHAVLGPDLPKVREDMQRHLVGVQSSVDAFERFGFDRLASGQLKPKPGIDRDFVEEVERLQQELKLWLTDDPLHKWWRASEFDTDISPSTILICHPALCGLITFDMYMKHHQIGKRLVDDRHMLVCTTYVLNALTFVPRDILDSHPIPAWPDLDHLLAMLERDDMRVKTPDGDIFQQCRNLSSLLGHDPAMVTKYIRSIKGIGPRAPLPAPICNGHGSCSCRVNLIRPAWPRRVIDLVINPAYTCEMHSFSLRDLQVMLKRLGAKAASVDTLHTAHAGQEQSVSRLCASKLRRAKKHKSDKFSLAQMLSFLEMALTTDSDGLYFDLLDLYMKCSDIMRSLVEIRSATQSRRGDRFDSVDLRVETQVVLGKIIALLNIGTVNDRLDDETLAKHAKLVDQVKQIITAIGGHLEGRGSDIMERMKNAQEGYCGTWEEESNSSKVDSAEE